MNSADTYIEDASLELIFPKIDGMLIADRIYHKPKKQDPLIPDIDIDHLYHIGYPSVIENKTELVLSTDLGDIKHNIPETVFGEAIRILFVSDLAGTTVDVKSRLFGKNLRKPIERDLKIEVVDF